MTAFRMFGEIFSMGIQEFKLRERFSWVPFSTQRIHIRGVVGGFTNLYRRTGTIVRATKHSKKSKTILPIRMRIGFFPRLLFFVTEPPASVIPHSGHEV
jgi:hypothetical protein